MSSDNNIEKATLIWDEYKYRHEHCWKLLFQITAAVVIVSVAPYTNEKVAMALGNCIILLPLLGIILTAFSYLRVKKELALWKDIRDRHIEFQRILLILDHNKLQKSTFKRDVLGYLIILGILDLFNMAIIAFVWIPALNDC